MRRKSYDAAGYHAIYAAPCSLASHAALPRQKVAGELYRASERLVPRGLSVLNPFLLESSLSAANRKVWLRVEHLSSVACLARHRSSPADLRLAARCKFVHS